MDARIHPGLKQVQDCKRFGFLFAGIFFIISALALYKTRNELFIVFLIAAFSFLAIAFLKPLALTRLRTQWIKIGFFVGQINATVILSVVFLLFFAPVGVIRRLSGKNWMGLRDFKESETSFRDSKPLQETNLQRMY
jgi:hypothetical protein